MNEEEIIKNIKEMIQWSDHNTYKIALQGILDLYNKEKEKNKLLEKQILEDSSYAMLTKLEVKLKYDINKINEKLLSDEYINNYRTAILKGIRTKCKEILNIIGE